MNKQNKDIEISIIIPTKNRGALILDTLNSLVYQNFPYKNFEVIIIDSSNDNSPELIKNYLQEKEQAGFLTTYLREERIGSHYAKNKGIQAAQGDIVLTIEDDAFANPNLLSEIANSFKNDASIVCVGGKVIPRFETPTQILQISKWLKKYTCMLTLLDLGDQEKTLNQAVLVGCNLAVKKHILYEVGGYNPDIIGNQLLGDGETGLQRKILRNKKYKVFYNPKAVVEHFVPNKRLNFSWMSQRHYNEGACYAHAYLQENKPSGLIILGMSLRKFLRAIICKIKSIIYKATDQENFYFFYFSFLQNKRQSEYFLQAFFYKKFRAFAFQEDWLKE